MNRRWVCPKCDNGVLAPSRPRKDDVRRYCLACSASTGRMVERTCPAADKERAARTAARTARVSKQRNTKRDAERAARTAGDVDLLAEAKRLIRLPALRDHFHGQLPDITFRRSARKSHSSGHCWYGSREIVVTIGTDPHDAPATLLHELCHAAVRYDGHSDKFWRLVQRAAREAWPEAHFDFANARHGWQTQRAIRHGIASLHDDERESA